MKENQKEERSYRELAEEYLAREGFSPVYGARPLRRSIQKYLENELALRILEGDFEEGDRIRVDQADGEGLSFTKA